MSFFLSFVCFSSVFFVLNGQCGSEPSRLKIKIETQGFSGTDSKIFATVLETNGDWTRWRILDNLDCNDFIVVSICICRLVQ